MNSKEPYQIAELQQVWHFWPVLHRLRNFCVCQC